MKQRKKRKINERVEGAKKVLTKGKRGDIIAELSQGSEKLNGQHGTLKTV